MLNFMTNCNKDNLTGMWYSWLVRQQRCFLDLFLNSSDGLITSFNVIFLFFAEVAMKSALGLPTFPKYLQVKNWMSPPT